MKQLFILLLLCPALAWGQQPPSLIFETANLMPKSDRILQFESIVTAHNKKYHPEGPYGVRMYAIISGPRAGSYNWVMGPAPWSAFDDRPAANGHDEDWAGNVMPNVLPQGSVDYWRFNTDKSRFPKDFNISKLSVWVVNIKSDGWDKVMSIMDDVKQVYAEKIPDETYGVYMNEQTSTSQGNDMTIIWFFDKWSWMGEDNGFVQKYNEVHGEGSFAKMIEDWRGAVDGVDRELWVYREDLSTNGPMVKVADRQ